jgi:hypothetical protein
MQVVLQATVCDCLALDPFAFANSEAIRPGIPI